MAKIIEFTGIPEAGKTTVIYKLAEEFKNYKVKIIDEASSKAKEVLKGNVKERTAYIVANIVNDYIEAINDDYDYILIDRGLYDRYFWNYFSYKRGDITYEEKQIRDFFTLHKLFDYRVDLLVVFFVSSDEAIKRRGGEGSFVTQEKLALYEKTLKEFLEEFDKTSVFEIDTTDKKIIEVVEKIKKII